MPYSHPPDFQTLFKQPEYVSLKNYLYNYRLRRAAIRNHFRNVTHEKILEIGSGISPIMDGKPNVVFFDLSFAAVQILKNNPGGGLYVVADATHLPFKSGSFTHSVCSEVMEHIDGDVDLIDEIARVMKPDGFAVLTVPHRMAYFSYDDVFVGHFRRYEIQKLTDLLRLAGFTITGIEKILGPVEKVAMLLATRMYGAMSNQSSKSSAISVTPDSAAPACLGRLFQILNIAFMGIAWLDARLFPKTMSTVLLFQTVKNRNSGIQESA